MEILFEDNHIIAVNKTTSDIVQVDKTGDQSLEEKVKAYIKLRYNKPGDVFLGVAHRIDRPVSGAVLFARTSKSLVRLNEMFQRKEVKKLYWAIVKEKPQSISDTLNHFIVRDQQKNKSYAFEKEGKDSKPASLTYTLIASAQNYHLLEIDLHTGRHHQIRCQLAKIGCPIKGDLKYGFPRSNPDGGISLHSRKIEFIHPVSKQPITIIANPPKDSLWDYFISITK